MLNEIEVLEIARAGLCGRAVRATTKRILLIHIIYKIIKKSEQEWKELQKHKRKIKKNSCRECLRGDVEQLRRA